jgi:hypothetical protein
MRTLALAILAACNVPNVHFTSGGDASATTDAPRPPPGGYVWARSLSQMQTQTINAAAGNIITPGYLYSTANLDGSDLLTSAGNADLTIASFTESDATNLYGMRHGSTASEFGLLSVLGQNNVPIITGVTGGTSVDLGQGVVAGGSDGFSDGYIGAYANGAPEWVQRITGSGDDKFLAMARGTGSTVWGGGWFENTATFNTATMTSVGSRDIFIAQFNIFTGGVAAVKQFGGAGRDELSGGGAASIDGSSIVLSGFFDGTSTLSFGGTAKPLTGTHGGLDLWVAKFDSSMTGVWAESFGGSGDDRDNNVVMDAAGDVYMTGTFTSAITLGAFDLTAAGGTDHFICKLDGATGNVIWAIAFGTAGAETAGRIAVDSNGHLAFAGPLDGAFEGGTTAGGKDALLAELSTTDGTRLWAHVYSTAGDDGGGGVVYGESGDLFASIGLGGPYDFGVPIVGDPNPLDVLLRIAP